MENSKSTSCGYFAATILPVDRGARADGISLAATYLGPKKASGTFRAKSRRRSAGWTSVITAFVFSTLAALVGSPRFAVAEENHTRVPTSRLELVMFEEKGCGYCRRWHKEVGPGYGLSDEGKRAPLKIVDLASAEASEFGRVVYTPTFVLLLDGEERGRITGYPGADFFWTMLSERLNKLDQKNENPVEDPLDPFNPYQDCD